MSYYDEEILAAKKAMEREHYTTLETGIYVEDELIEFAKISFRELKSSMFLPNSFIPMPTEIKDIKYPSKNAPAVLLMHLNTAVNFGFNLLPITIEAKELKALTEKFRIALKNVNPTISFNQIEETQTHAGNEIDGFDFNGYSIDGQSYSKMIFARMDHFVIQGIFNCFDRDKLFWSRIVDQVFETIEEDRS